MIRQGTRIARPRKSSCGGGALSNQPPQSSQITTIAVESQYELSPIALTIDVTHGGPMSLCAPGWSESRWLGVTQLIDARLPFGISLRTCVCGAMMSFFQSLPLRTYLIASNGDQMPALRSFVT